VVDKSDVGGGLAVAASMVGAAVSWVAGLGVITVLISVGLGSILTYLVGSKTQKNAWKRETAFRKVDDIYGPLYFELNKVSQHIANPSQLFYFNAGAQNEITWESIKASYKYYLVDTPLRKELDEFFAAFKEFNVENAQRTSIADEKILPRLREAFGQDVQAASYSIVAMNKNGTMSTLQGGTLEWPILEGVHPRDFTMRQFPHMKNPQLELSLQRQGQMKPVFTVSDPNPDILSKFDELIRVVTEEVRRDPRIVALEEKRIDLAAWSGDLKEKLRIKTEEPWNV
jgi:hypothetical protein